MEIIFTVNHFFSLMTAYTEIYTLSLHDALPISLAISAAFIALARTSTRIRAGPWSRSAKAISRLMSTHYLVEDRKSTRLNSSHTVISYAVFCLKKKKWKHYN